ncbi:hypothetical protein CAQU_03300 [Corynebacterium aquilae DSM 44791]|uniref:Uncharacterized protein n=1 Tax=Corynebacterium aquilae DSM 44791 TaxID=1431546 RepID=A0A1L7CEK4_9CORY|nr:hypothetical protein CAQU_03300 [Corynebacterium aquilae DSM 44791]
MYARLNVVGLVGIVGVFMALTYSLPTGLQLPAGWWGALPMGDSFVVRTYGLSAADGLAITGIIAPWTHEFSWDFPVKPKSLLVGQRGLLPP